MAAETASLCWILLFQVFVFASADQKTIITAEPGQDVTLTCRAPNKNNKNKIVVVTWRRTDLENEHVLLYRNGQFGTAKQHRSFKNRVDLQDKQVKDGDMSLILKDVTTDDDATYECSVVMEGTRSWELINIIYLRVVAPPDQAEGDTEAAGKEDGSVGLKVGLLVPLVVLAVVGFAIYKRKQLVSKISEDQIPLQFSQDTQFCMKTKQK